MVSTYFDKDLVEKSFRSLKGVIKLRPIRHWLYNRVIAHIFICYLAYLLLSLLKYRLNKIEVSPGVVKKKQIKLILRSQKEIIFIPKLTP
jgi:transposase